MSSDDTPATRQVEYDDDSECWEGFAAYAKDRFDAEDRRIVELRNWARQLAAAVSVVIGLETNLVAQLWRLLVEQRTHVWLFGGVALLFATMAYQLVLLVRTIRKGYVASPLVGPERPIVLVDHLIDCNFNKTRKTIAFYYANAHEGLVSENERIAAATGDLAKGFAGSLFLLLLAIAFSTIASLVH